MASHIGRRKFLATLGGAVVSWSLAARGQQSSKLPMIGVIADKEHDWDAGSCGLSRESSHQPG